MVGEKQQGYVLVSVIVFATILMAVASVLLQYISATSSSLREVEQITGARNAARSGVIAGTGCFSDGPFVEQLQIHGSVTLHSLAPNLCRSWGGVSVPPGTVGDYFTLEARANRGGQVELSATGMSQIGSLRRSTVMRANIPNQPMVVTPPLQQTVTVPTSTARQSVTTSVKTNFSATNCMVNDGQAYCWGAGGPGLLGNSSSGISNRPLQVNGGPLAGKTVENITIGDNHACALASGQIICWGGNSNGQLGNGGTSWMAGVTAVTSGGVLKNKKIIAVQAGSRHTCALAGGRVYCWGDNTDGQLGDGTGVGQREPIAVSEAGGLHDKEVTRLVAGARHSCVIADGQAYCWGSNDHQQIGDNTWERRHVPVRVAETGVMSDKVVTDISAGDDYTCAVASNKAYCWGGNNNGQLGNGNTSWQGRPSVVGGVLSGKKVTRVWAGRAHTCALAEGRIYCWGFNSYGQLGNGNTSQQVLPVEASLGPMEGKMITDVSVGREHTCAVADYRTYCWGGNGSGQLGSGNNNPNKTPAQVQDPAGSSRYTYSHNQGNTLHRNCAVAGATAYCWNRPVDGYQGVNYRVPLTVGVSSGILGRQAVTQVGGNCVIAVGRVYCWGERWRNRLLDYSARGSLAGKVATKVVEDDGAACAIADGQLHCWGRNFAGRLGVGGFTDRYEPTLVPGLNNVTDVDRFIHTTCAIADGRTYCWGDNPAGMLGNGSVGNPTPTPAAVDKRPIKDGRVATQVSVGRDSVCAVYEVDLYCWGSNSQGQLGVSGPNQSIPARVELGGTVTQVSTGERYACAVASNKAYCWGSNNTGQLGDGTLANRNQPTEVIVNEHTKGKTITQISTFKDMDGVNTGYSTCAVMAGRVYCWGFNGRAGNGTLGKLSTGDATKDTITQPAPLLPIFDVSRMVRY